MDDKREHYKKMNKDISDAIKVSQMMESDGYEAFKNYLDEQTKAIRFQDILGLKNDESRLTQQGIAMAFEDIKQYFVNMEALSKKPMVDPDTGEAEILNKNKKDDK